MSLDKALTISFRPLLDTDFSLLHKWLNTPHVSEWWSLESNHQPSLADVQKHFLPRTDGKEPVDCFIILFDEKPVGMIQSCKLDDYPEEKAEFGLEGKYAGIDLFIGEEEYVHKGLGSSIIRGFLKEIVFKKYDVDYCFIDPDPKNTIAIKAYRKAGFKYLKTAWYRKDNTDAYLMSMRSDEV